MSGTKESYSPTSHLSEHPSQTLRAIIAQYQRERMWIKHTQDVIALARRDQFRNIPDFDVQTPVTVNKHSNNLPIWKRRKVYHRLHLNDLSPVRLSQTLVAHDAYGSKLLELFAALLEARIESCRRVDELLSQSMQQTQSIKQNFP